MKRTAAIGCGLGVAAVLALTFSHPVFAEEKAAAGANVYVQHNLVSDIPGLADFTDANLVNPWGLSASATSPFWASNHDKGNTTLYNGSGIANPLVVTIPAGGGGSAQSKPTGQVNNGSTSFVVANGRSASFIFATEDGTISAWNSGATAQLMVDNSGTGAVYKGLAIDSTAPRLFAANFNTGNIDVFDGKFAPTTVAGGFKDSSVPAGFAPFNIWNISGKLYVTYAKQDPTKHFDVFGAGNGYVAVFDLNGNLLKHLVSNGPLNSPWGVAIAPANWGAFGGALLVGNFGDGTVNAFDATEGTSLGTLQGVNGKPIVIQGLWAILFGNGRATDPNALYFVAGITNGDVKVHGLYGSLAPPAAVTNIVNAASMQGGPIAPGEIVLITGGTIGPFPLVSAKIPASGSIGTALGNTTVTINGIQAPILYASANATSVVVPYGLAGFPNTTVVVKSGNQTTAAFATPVALSAPGLFTLDETGNGQVVAFNQDGTLNGAQSPAAKGTVVILYATGDGPNYPAGQDGVVTGTTIHAPVLPVLLTIGGVPAPVLYSVSSPGTIAGVLQIAALIPAGSASGAVPIVLKVDNASSQSTATINVK